MKTTYTRGVHVAKERKTGVARLFRDGGSQAVRLPRGFRFAGDSVRIRSVGRGVLLEPMITDLSEWFAELDKFRAEPFMPDGRRQPKLSRQDVFR